jgi:magnesium and cobalt transporter
LRFLGGRNGQGSLRDTLEELIEEREDMATPLDDVERTLVANILTLRELSAEDVMVPRADIVAVTVDASLAEVIERMTASGHSRLPVYRETLDDTLGFVHIKDVLAWRGRGESFRLIEMVRPVLFVAPSIGILRLLLDMRQQRTHLALVVDEFGGVDGLITLEDLIEEIVGEIADEHDRKSTLPPLSRRPDGSVDADGRASIEELDDCFGPLIDDETRDEVDTIGGLVVHLAGRIAKPGERIEHPSGLIFEVLDADPRRVKRVRIRLTAPPGSEVSGVGNGAGRREVG